MFELITHPYVYVYGLKEPIAHASVELPVGIHLNRNVGDRRVRLVETVWLCPEENQIYQQQKKFELSKWFIEYGISK